MKYLHLFNTAEEHDAARSWGVGYDTPWVAKVRTNEKVTYNKGWDETYLTFEAIEDCVFGTSFNPSGMNYSLDEGKTWKSITNSISATVKAGDKIMFKGEIEPRKLLGVGRFKTTGKFNAMGNPFSLIYGDNFVGINDISNKANAFERMFYGCTTLISAENLSLPATTLSEDCYNLMFSGCTSLTTAPSMFPATKLADNCYKQMFQGCTALTTAPSVLPATTLANNCYQSMFSGCISLTKAPELPATTLANQCYRTMFSGCTALTTAPSVLPATTLANNCYYCMFSSCTSLATSPEIHAMVLADNCCANMFSDCSSLRKAPSVLPAMTLAASAYSAMFSGCTALVKAPDLPALELSDSCYKQMFSGCTSLIYIKAMYINTGTFSINNWVSDVASSGTFVKSSAATWTDTGTSGVPSGWQVIDETGKPWVAPS